MRFTATTSSGGVTERSFTLGEIPGVLWTPGDPAGPRPLILMGHGGGQHKNHPGIVNRARRFAAAGFAVAAIDAPNHGDRPRTPEFEELVTAMRAGRASVDTMHDLLTGPIAADWAAVLDELAAGPVGFWGMSMGCGLGVPFIAAEPRVRAAVVGLYGSPALTKAAAGITVPVLFLAQWDDQLVPRADSLALFDAFASPAKSLHANPGGHGDLPRFETDSALAFFSRHLT